MDLPAQVIAATGHLVHKPVDSWNINDYKVGKRLVMRGACGNSFYYGEDISPDDRSHLRCKKCFKL
jgi:hypothetical protein